MKNFLSADMSRRLAGAVLKTKAQSPTILFGAGVVGVVSTVVLASKATLKLEMVKTLKHDKYSEQDRAKDKVVVYTQTVMNISKLYAPAVGIGILSIAALTGSHHILTKRNAALTAAYAGLDRALRDYRSRVTDDIGAEREARLWQPTEKVDVVLEDGKKSKVEVATERGGSPYKVVFDETNDNWQRADEYNQLFIQAQQNWANDLLRAKGHVFLNEVHDMLGIPRTKAGQIVGWVMGGDGDNYIDFGVFNNIARGMEFVTGNERSIWLDFNVDGPVLDLL